MSHPVTPEGWLPTNDGGGWTPTGSCTQKGGWTTSSFVVARTSPLSRSKTCCWLMRTSRTQQLSVCLTTTGERVIAVVVVPRDGAKIDGDHVREFVREQMRSSRTLITSSSPTSPRTLRPASCSGERSASNSRSMVCPVGWIGDDETSSPPFGAQMELIVGSRWRSAVCDTEMIVIRAPDNDIVLECGGHAVIACDATHSSGLELDPQFAGGTGVGKRFAAADNGIEVLATKAGKGTIAAGGVPIPLRGAKPLPASD